MANMMTEMLKVLAEDVVVIHVAYQCGCVKTFGLDEVPVNTCPTHGAAMQSHTRERTKLDELHAV